MIALPPFSAVALDNSLDSIPIVLFRGSGGSCNAAFGVGLSDEVKVTIIPVSHGEHLEASSGFWVFTLGDAKRDAKNPPPLSSTFMPFFCLVGALYVLSKWRPLR